MESSETRQKTISLGKQLVALLGEEHNVDMLSRWLAHYVAEQMTLAESTTGADKAAAEEQCYHTILKLWEHRAALPVRVRPFENFDAVFRALERLDPDSSRGYYHLFGRPETDPKPGSVEEMTAFISSVDGAARVLIELALSEAIEKATDESTKTILRDAVPTARDQDLTAMRCLMEIAEEPADSADDTKVVEKLRARLQALDAFAKMCREIRKGFEADLRHRESAEPARKRVTKTKTKKG